MSLLYPDQTHMQTLLDAVNKRRVVMGDAEWLMPPGPSLTHMIAIRDWIKTQLPLTGETGSTGWIDFNAIEDAGGYISWLDVNYDDPEEEAEFPILLWNEALFTRLGIGRVVDGGAYDGYVRFTGESDDGTMTRWHIESLYSELFLIVKEMKDYAPVNVPFSSSIGALSGDDGSEPATLEAARAMAIAESTANTGNYGRYGFKAWSTSEKTDDPTPYYLADYYYPVSTVCDLSGFNGSEYLTQVSLFVSGGQHPLGWTYSNMGIWTDENKWKRFESADGNIEFLDGETGPGDWPDSASVEAASPDKVIIGAGSRNQFIAEFDFDDPA